MNIFEQIRAEEENRPIAKRQPVDDWLNKRLKSMETGAVNPTSVPKKVKIDSSGLNWKQRKEQKKNVKERGEVTRGVLRGIDQLQGMGYGLAAIPFAVTHEFTGIGKAPLKYLAEGMKRNESEAKINPSTAKKFSQIYSDMSKQGVVDTVKDLGKWTESTLGELAPGAVETVLSSTIKGIWNHLCIV